MKRGCAALLCVLAMFVSACDDGQNGTSPAPAPPPPPPTTAAADADGAKPATRPDPNADVDVPALLAAGGANWSALTGGDFLGRALPDGKDYFLWPAERDAAYVPKGKKLTVALHYRARPDGKPITGGTGYVNLVGGTPERRLYLSGPVTTFDEQPAGGSASVTFEPYLSTEPAEVVLFLTRPGYPEPASNVLRLKVAAPQ